jgi:hypothetical protein
VRKVHTFGEFELIDPSVWNNHQRIPKSVAMEHIKQWESLTPSLEGAPASEATDKTAEKPDDLDTPDEVALRALLLGIAYRTLEDYPTSRKHLDNAHDMHARVKISTWIGGVAAFERVVLNLHEAESQSKAGTAVDWKKVLDDANKGLDHAISLAPSSVDLSSRLDTRIAMLRDEIATKRELVGVR